MTQLDMAMIVLTIGMAVLLVIVVYLTLVGIALGTADIDPRYVCLYEFQFPFAQQCYDQELASMFERLLNQSRDYNNTK